MPGGSAWNGLGGPGTPAIRSISALGRTSHAPKPSDLRILTAAKTPTTSTAMTTVPSSRRLVVIPGRYRVWPGQHPEPGRERLCLKVEEQALGGVFDHAQTR